MLFGVAIRILIEAQQRFFNSAEIRTLGCLGVPALGLVINLINRISMRTLSSGSKHSSLNFEGAYLKVWSDTLGSAGVVAGALVMRYTGWLRVASMIAVDIGVWVVGRTQLLLKQSLHILLEGVPAGIVVSKVEKVIGAVNGVLSVHDLPIGSLTTGKSSLTAHVVHAPER